MNSARKISSRERVDSYIASTSTRDIVSRLSVNQPIVREKLPRQRWTYYDTFDWRIHRKGLSLRIRRGQSGFEIELLDLPGRSLLLTRSKKRPVFAVDLPAGRLRSRLEPLIEMRALLPTVKLRTQGELLRVLDQRRKTVCRLVLTRASAKRPGSKKRHKLPGRLRIEGVRGYSKAYQKSVGLVEQELHLESANRSLLEDSLLAIGAQPEKYSSKVELKLEAHQRADEAVKLILIQLLETMRANEPGVIDDLDSEFLHDFRVAVRRARSALAQIKGVFPRPTVRRFRKEFSWLGKVTGPVRDLDVYLLKIPAYQESLPPPVRPHLLPLQDYLLAKKRREHRKLVQSLHSRRYFRLIAGWQGFLQKPVPRKTRLPRAMRPVLEVASERIWRVYSKVIRKGAGIDPQTHPEELHVLRIECKKLRYLMEFFRSLYPANHMKRLIKELKRLQDNLGDFNDYEVQQATLKRIVARPEAIESLPVETLMAIGRLLERLEAGQQAERDLFLRRFKAFSSRTNARAFSKLFQPQTTENNPS